MSVAKSNDVIHVSKGDGVATGIDIALSDLKKAVLVLRAINHKLRKEILLLIEENPNITVTQIYVKLRLEQSVASQHLGRLRKAGVLKTFRDGKDIQYSINKQRVKEIVDLLPQLGG